MTDSEKARSVVSTEGWDESAIEPIANALTQARSDERRKVVEECIEMAVNAAVGCNRRTGGPIYDTGMVIAKGIRRKLMPPSESGEGTSHHGVNALYIDVLDMKDEGVHIHAKLDDGTTVCAAYSVSEAENLMRDLARKIKANQARKDSPNA